MRNLNKIFKEGRLGIRSPEEMRGLGRRVAAELEAGQVLGLVGGLGAGKTCLVRGILEGLGASVPASSPTFSLVHEHRDGRIPAVHFDFYRLRSPEEALSFGWEDYWDCGAVLLVEWADKFGGALMPGGADWLFLRHAGAGERTVEWR